MYFFEKASKGPMGANKRRSGPESNDPAFEQWVARQLHKMYDEVLAEEVPSELMRVVGRLTGGSGNATGKSDDCSDHGATNGVGPPSAERSADPNKRSEAPSRRR